MNKFLAWFRQPTTVAGLSALAGTTMGVMTGTVSPSAALSLAVGSAVAMILPDNTAAVAASKLAASDLLALSQTLSKPATPAASSSTSTTSGSTPS